MNRYKRKILKWPPVAAMINKSKKIILPGFEGVPLYDAMKFFWKQVENVGLTERASAISFNFIMAIPAICICIFTLVPYLPISKQFTAELLRITRDISPNQNTYNLVNNFLEDFLNTPRGGLLSLGFILVIFYSSNAMLGVINTFDKSIYHHKKEINFIKKRWKAIQLTLVVVGLLFGMVILLSSQGILFEKIIANLELGQLSIFLISIFRWVITVGLFFYSISVIYKYGPSVTKRWRTLSAGAFVATGLTILTTTGFSFWVNNFGSYNKVYGSIGTVLVLMVLIYLNSLILLIGFELNVSITYAKISLAEKAKNNK